MDPVTGLLVTAIVAEAGAIAKLYADTKALQKEVRDNLLARAEAAENASEKLAEASRLTRETHGILKSGRY